ncbi:cytochrome P450 [Nocardia sp. alder85J]|uniref:cytochrome P450 n=1 Tax=Nocardia sp. alder85J TaxID=2862949 RepID=UPI001CD1ECB8|nr:cytochrome P450 [Nocardia sp. alder85J]MCX4091594.1 cytochrome P450 [Nocardia sp. alder85J]
MSAEEVIDERKSVRQFEFERHAPEYRPNFEAITREMHRTCPVAWSDTYGGHWVAAGNREVFDLARSPHLSNDRDVHGERRGYEGVYVPTPPMNPKAPVVRGGFLEMDPPEQQAYRQALNPYLSPAAINRWIPFLDEVARACLDEKIDTGRIDFVDDLANIVPAVFTLALMGIPLRKWSVYCEPAHALIYTPPASPDSKRVWRAAMAMGADLYTTMLEIRETPRPGLIDALNNLRIDGQPAPDIELVGALNLIIGGGFDTTTALTAHSLEWLSEHPAERAALSGDREVLLDSATEEFLRYFTPAPGDGRTIAADCTIAGVDFREGERLWLSWAMANRDPSLFPDPDTVDLGRRGNRHFSFGLGIHRCIGSNVARNVFKRMLLAVFDRMPDFHCDAAGAVHYDTVGVINGMKHLPADFTPGPRLGPGLDETLDALQTVCDEQRPAAPVVRSDS